VESGCGGKRRKRREGLAREDGIDEWGCFGQFAEAASRVRRELTGVLATNHVFGHRLDEHEARKCHDRHDGGPGSDETSTHHSVSQCSKGEAMQVQLKRSEVRARALQSRTILWGCEGRYQENPLFFLPFLALTLVVFCLLAGTAAAQGFGPNQSEPDSSLVMPLVAQTGYTTFFAISNVGASDGEPGGTFPEPVEILWEFYDESGELVAEATRYVLGEGGTDIVSPDAVRSKDASGNLGPSTSLVGRNGFVVVSAFDDEPRLIGNFTVANISTSAAWGAAAAGLGTNGLLVPGDAAIGTTFAIDSLEDDILIVLGIDDFGFVPTSLTWGYPAEPGEVLMPLLFSMHTNKGFDPAKDEASREVEGSAFFTRLRDILPSTERSISGTISVAPTDDEVAILGFYGQALGQFGAGQTLRMVPAG
jgi:hypothetical protein